MAVFLGRHAPKRWSRNVVRVLHIYICTSSQPSLRGTETFQAVSRSAFFLDKIHIHSKGPSGKWKRPSLRRVPLSKTSSGVFAALHDSFLVPVLHADSCAEKADNTATQFAQRRTTPKNEEGTKLLRCSPLLPFAA